MNKQQQQQQEQNNVQIKYKVVLISVVDAYPPF